MRPIKAERGAEHRHSSGLFFFRRALFGNPQVGRDPQHQFSERFSAKIRRGGQGALAVEEGGEEEFKGSFKVNEREISDADITEWLRKHRESDPATIKEEDNDDDSDVKCGKDTAADMLHEPLELEVFFPLFFFSSFLLFFFSIFLSSTSYFLCLYLAEHFFIISFSAAI